MFTARGDQPRVWEQPTGHCCPETLIMSSPPHFLFQDRSPQLQGCECSCYTVCSIALRKTGHRRSKERKDCGPSGHRGSNSQKKLHLNEFQQVQIMNEQRERQRISKIMMNVQKKSYTVKNTLLRTTR